MTDLLNPFPQDKPIREKFIQLFEQYPLKTLVHNIHAKSDMLSLNHTNGEPVRLPVTVIDDVHPNCFVVSPHAAIIDYGQDETVKLPTWQQLPLRTTLKSISQYLKFAKIDKVATLNNYCLSTNTFDKSILTLNVHKLTHTAVHAYPSHALLIRSLNGSHHQDFLNRLAKHGWQMITSRQVYLFDNPTQTMRHKDSKRDAKLLQDGRFDFRPCISDDDYQQAVHWYNRLYLDKYSYQNVQFTATAFKAMHALGILDIYLLVDNDDNSVGVVGVVCDDSEITTPIVGYNTHLPQELGLYRRVIAKAIQLSIRSGRRLNLSSGAPQFKRLRGGMPVIEYTAVYTHHLPQRQHLPWQLLHQVSPYYAKLLQHYQL